jgi:hypothetical protein
MPAPRWRQPTAWRDRSGQRGRADAFAELVQGAQRQRLDRAHACGSGREAKLSVEHGGAAEAMFQTVRTRSDGKVRLGRRERRNACWVVARLLLRVGGGCVAMGAHAFSCVRERAGVRWLGHNGGPASARRDAPYDGRYKQGDRGPCVARRVGQHGGEY